MTQLYGAAPTFRKFVRRRAVKSYPVYGNSYGYSNFRRGYQRSYRGGSARSSYNRGIISHGSYVARPKMSTWHAASGLTFAGQDGNQVIGRACHINVLGNRQNSVRVHSVELLGTVDFTDSDNTSVIWVELVKYTRELGVLRDGTAAAPSADVYEPGPAGQLHSKPTHLRNVARVLDRFCIQPGLSRTVAFKRFMKVSADFNVPGANCFLGLFFISAASSAGQFSHDVDLGFAYDVNYTPILTGV